MEVGWTQRRSNVNILETFGSRRELMAVVRRRQMTFLGHIMRAKGLKNLAVTGRLADTISRGRTMMNYLNQMK